MVKNFCSKKWPKIFLHSKMTIKWSKHLTKNFFTVTCSVQIFDHFRVTFIVKKFWSIFSVQIFYRFGSILLKKKCFSSLFLFFLLENCRANNRPPPPREKQSFFFMKEGDYSPFSGINFFVFVCFKNYYTYFYTDQSNSKEIKRFFEFFVWASTKNTFNFTRRGDFGYNKN